MPALRFHRFLTETLARRAAPATVDRMTLTHPHTVRWIAVSLLLLAADMLLTWWAITQLGAVEGNPVAAAGHTTFGLLGYTVVLVPLMVARGVFASYQGSWWPLRVGAVASVVTMIAHTVVLANNVAVIAGVL